MKITYRRRPMRLVRQASVLLLWAALLTSRGLFAQSPVAEDSSVAATVFPFEARADQARVSLRPVDLRYVQPALPQLLPSRQAVKALYVNAWAFGSSKLWDLVKLVGQTEINALVVDVKDDTGCLLYPSAVPTAQLIGANTCTRAKDARARLD